LPDPKPAAERAQARIDLARGYLEEGEFDRARPALNTALEIYPRSVEAHVLLALLNESEGENALARQQYRQALKIEPRNSQALNNYGSFLYSRGDYEEAVKVLRLLVKDENYRARSQAYENLGLAELKIGEVERAREAFARALRLNFTQPRASLELADLAYAEGDYRIAQEYYDGFRTQARQTPRTLCLGMKLAGVSGDADRQASYALALSNLFPKSSEAADCPVPD
jgi:type IV pilus assembly protein PilF